MKGVGKHIDINCLPSVLERSSINRVALVRLFCVCRNDFNHSSSVATKDRLIRTYVHSFNFIGDLNSIEYLQALLYLPFLRAKYTDGNIPQDLQRELLMTSQWKQKGRQLVLYRPNDLLTSDILLQDEDIDLVFRRAIHFNIDKCWLRALDEDLHDVSCDASVEFEENGAII